MKCVATISTTSSFESLTFFVVFASKLIVVAYSNHILTTYYF